MREQEFYLASLLHVLEGLIPTFAIPTQIYTYMCVCVCVCIPTFGIPPNYTPVVTEKNKQWFLSFTLNPA